MLQKAEFYIVNYNAAEICQQRLEEYGEKSVLARINMVPHGFLYQDANIG